MEAARTAAALEPKRPEGPFWLAANMGALAESFGMRQGIKYRKPIRESLELVLKLDPAFQQGSADRALGRWYFKVPGLFGGSNEKSEATPAQVAHLQPEQHRQLVLPRPRHCSTWGESADAKQAFQKVIDAPFDPDWTPEDREWKGKAKDALTKLE